MALVHRVGWDPQLCARSPWLWPLSGAAKVFAQHTDWPSLSDLDAAYRAHTRGHSAAELAFRANVRKQDKRSEDGRIVLHALYDARISVSREVPTRERDWHDLLNMLCFATFPHSKYALHSRQFACLSERVDEHTTRLPGRRTPEQDALTLFDEGGVALVARAEDMAQLTAAVSGDSEALCLALCGARRVRIVPFGHALFEHELEGVRCPGGCTQIVSVPELWADDREFLHSVDLALCERIRDRTFFQSPRCCGHIRLAHFAL
jgi:hypothetical protein